MRNRLGLLSVAVCAALFVAPVAVRAESVGADRARLAAKSVFGKAAKGEARLRHVATGRRTADGGLGRIAVGAEDTLFYVFDFGGNGGFVIVSADDGVRPVLGYSDAGVYDPNNMPPNMAGWMEGLRRQVAWARERGIRSGAALREWERFSDVTDVMPLSAAVSPLLRTQWDQYEPYNLLCPMADGVRAAAGCAITAWAQIMKFHNHPARGVGQSEAYTTYTYNISVPSVNFEADYRWADMLNTYDENEENTPQTLAVATLMYHLGVSVKADYLPEGSIADGLAGALTTHFGYDKSMRRVDRERFQRVYGKAAYEGLIKEQIDAGRPVLYGGSDPRAGHEFIVDGYNNSGDFHINWGWGGRYNGYYAIDAFVDISADMYDFSNIRYQYAYVDIKPDAGGVGPAGHDPKFTLAEIAVSKAAVAPFERFTVNAKITCDTAAFVDAARPMLVGAALVDGRDSIAAVVGRVRADLYPWKPDSAAVINCEAPAFVQAGAYKLRIAVSEYDYNPAAKEYIPRGWELLARTVTGVPNGVDINVTEVPVITAQPSNRRVDIGASATFTVAAKSNGPSAISGYKWQVETADTILYEDFEDAAGAFATANGTQTNKWIVGSAVANGNGKSAYVSNDGGASNAYSAASASVAHIYVDVAFPAYPNAQPYTLTFDWKGMGKDKPLECYNINEDLVCTGFGGGVDYLQVGLADTGVSPQAGQGLTGMDLGIYYGAAEWKKAVCVIPAINAGKTKRLFFTWYNEATDSAVNPPIAIDNVAITGNVRFVDVKEGTGAASASYTTPPASPSMNGSRYRCVVTNAAGNSTVSNSAALAVGDMEIAVSARDRVVPPPAKDAAAALATPVQPIASGITAGPNAALKAWGGVSFFRQGARVKSASLRIYDASGGAVGKIVINDDNAPPNTGKRVVGSWNLTDKKGNPVPPGPYLIKGVIKTADGKRERVSSAVAVR